MSPNFKAFLAGFVGTVLLVAGCEAFAQVRDHQGREQVPTIIAMKDGSLKMAVMLLPPAPEGLLPYVCLGVQGEPKVRCFIVRRNNNTVFAVEVTRADIET